MNLDKTARLRKALKPLGTEPSTGEVDTNQSAIQRRLQGNRQGAVKLLDNHLEKKQLAAAVSSPAAAPVGVEPATTPAGAAFTSGSTGEGLTEAEFNKVLKDMMGAAPGKSGVTSGKRDSAKQKELWDKAVKKYGSEAAARKWVARPGTSKHEHGVAADLNWEDDAVKAWFHANADKYGLYFPMAHEPWHIQINPKSSYWNQQAAQPAQQLGGHAVVANKTTGDPNLDFIIANESGFDPNAKNPKSSAFGIGQMIIANRKAYGQRFGFDPNTVDPDQQLTMMNAYIKDRYGTVEKAAAFKRQHGWY